MIFPTAGSIDTQIDVSSQLFAPGAEVTFVVGYVSRIDETPTTFSGPIAVQHANDSGRNEVQVFLRDAPGIVIPSEPGFVVFRATSSGAGARTADSIFVFTVDGQRPLGSGEVHLSATAANGTAAKTAIYAWRRAGTSEGFYSPYAGYLQLPLIATIPWLTDGDWEVLVLGSLDTVAVGEGRIDTANAAFCGSIVSSCGVPPRPLRIKRVTIRDAQPVDVTIRLGDPTLFPESGYGMSHHGQPKVVLPGAQILLIGLLLAFAGVRLKRAV